MSIFIILKDANSPVPVSGNEAHREGSLLMTGGELRADKVRDVLCLVCRKWLSSCKDSGPYRHFL